MIFYWKLVSMYGATLDPWSAPWLRNNYPSIVVIVKVEYRRPLNPTKSATIYLPSVILSKFMYK